MIIIIQPNDLSLCKRRKMFNGTSIKSTRAGREKKNNNRDLQSENGLLLSVSSGFMATCEQAIKLCWILITLLQGNTNNYWLNFSVPREVHKYLARRHKCHAKRFDSNWNEFSRWLTFARWWKTKNVKKTVTNRIHFNSNFVTQKILRELNWTDSAPKRLVFLHADHRSWSEPNKAGEGDSIDNARCKKKAGYKLVVNKVSDSNGFCLFRIATISSGWSVLNSRGKPHVSTRWNNNLMFWRTRSLKIVSFIVDHAATLFFLMMT